MSWTDITRAEHSRQSDRYPTDLTDTEWAVALPLVPPSPAGGRPRTSDMRELMNAILYVAGGGIPWRMLPKDFPAVSTVRGYFYRWRNDGTLALLNFALVQAARELEGKEPCPSAGIIDSQSVKTTESGGIAGYDAPLGGASLACRARDGGYAGNKLKQALMGNRDWTIEVVRRCDDQKGFKVLPRRWVVERTFAWLGRSRRLAKDWEKSIQSSTAWTLIAHIRTLMRRMARHCDK